MNQLDIYIKLGQFFSYDESYYIADTLEEKQEIFDKNIDQIQDDKAICSQLSKMYAQLLNKFGIEAKEFFKEGRYCGHVVVHFKIDDKLYCADLTHDLLQIKKGFKTQEFMKIPDDSEEQFEEITDEEYANKIDSEFVCKLIDSDLRTISSDEDKKALLLEIVGKQENIFRSKLKPIQDLGKEVTTEMPDVALEDETEHFQNLQEQHLKKIIKKYLIKQ